MEVRLEFKAESRSVGCYHKNDEEGNSHQWGEFRAAIVGGETEYQLWLMHTHIYEDMDVMLVEMEAAVELLESVQKATVDGSPAQPPPP